MKYQIVKRSFMIAGKKKSINLEEPVWRSLNEIATYRDVTLLNLLTNVASSNYPGKLSSAIRLFILSFYRAQLDLQHGHDFVITPLVRSPSLLLH
jgi:predicted DNA-binding ribbon-helix-helix protein